MVMGCGGGKKKKKKKKKNSRAQKIKNAKWVIDVLLPIIINYFV
jgi:hypothetical protein